MKNSEMDPRDGADERLWDEYLFLDSLNTESLASAHRSRIEKGLRSTDDLVRKTAVEAAGLAAMGRSILKAAKSEVDSVVLAEAAEQLGELEYEPARSWLEELASGHPDALVRGSAAMGLAEVIGEGADSVLLALLESESSERVMACIACSLAWLGYEDSIEMLVRLLDSSNVHVRAGIANLLWYYRPEPNRRLLKTTLEHALEVETIPGVAADLRRAVEVLDSD